MFCLLSSSSGCCLSTRNGVITNFDIYPPMPEFKPHLSLDAGAGGWCKYSSKQVDYIHEHGLREAHLQSYPLSS